MVLNCFVLARFTPLELRQGFCVRQKIHPRVPQVTFDLREQFSDRRFPQEFSAQIDGYTVSERCKERDAVKRVLQ